MKIVLTNDDGLDAPGLALLEKIAGGFGEAVVIAPAEEQSYVGHRVTTSSIPVAQEDSQRFRVSGTPADCARIALRCVATDAEWVLSGINRGGNLGVDTYISGTVAAAREATILGRKAIAISQFISRRWPFEWSHSAPRAALVLRELMAKEPESGVYWNVNLPHPEDPLAQCDIVFCPLDNSPLDVRYRREGSIYVYTGSYPDRGREPGSDVDHCFSGRITVTPVRVR